MLFMSIPLNNGIPVMTCTSLSSDLDLSIATEVPKDNMLIFKEDQPYMQQNLITFRLVMTIL